MWNLGTPGKPTKEHSVLFVQVFSKSKIMSKLFFFLMSKLRALLNNQFGIISIVNSILGMGEKRWGTMSISRLRAWKYCSGQTGFVPERSPGSSVPHPSHFFPPQRPKEPRNNCYCITTPSSRSLGPWPPRVWPYFVVSLGQSHQTRTFHLNSRDRLGGRSFP